MKTFNREVGRLAEEMAIKELQSKGYKILERNFSNRFGEIDIIAREKKTLVFVEVKAKTGTQFGLPEEMITPGKIRKVMAMAAVYLGERTALCRLDVVAIVLSPTNELVRLTHYENVY